MLRVCNYNIFDHLCSYHHALPHLMLFLFVHQSALISTSASSLLSGQVFINLMCIIQALREQLWDTPDVLPWVTSMEWFSVLNQEYHPPWTCVLMHFCHIRSLGLYIRGVEEESRSRKEGLFQEDECIIKINNTDLMDKTFSQSVQHGSLCHVLPVSSPCFSPVAFTQSISCLVLHCCETAAENRAGCSTLVHHWHQFERPF